MSKKCLCLLLDLMETHCFFSGNTNFSNGNQLKHLDLSRCQNSGNNEEDVLVQITASCQLEKLSLGCLYISKNFVKSIEKSALSLKVLDLSDCRGKQWYFHTKKYISSRKYCFVKICQRFDDSSSNLFTRC